MTNSDHNERLSKMRFITRVVFITLAFSVLNLGSPARANDLFTKASLTCHFDHGGKWNYDVSPPKLTPIKPWRIEITKINLKHGRATMRGENLEVRRKAKSLNFSRFWKFGAPGVISVYSFSVLGGFPAVAQAGFLQVAGHCN
jgi:hypothetical protein